MKIIEPKIGDKMKLLSIDQIETRLGKWKDRMLNVEFYIQRKDDIFIVQEISECYEDTGISLLLVQNERNRTQHFFYYPCEIDYPMDELEVELI